MLTRKWTRRLDIIIPYALADLVCLIVVQNLDLDIKLDKLKIHTLLSKQLVKTKSLQAPYPCIFKTNGMDLNFPLTHFLTYFSTNAFSENAPIPQACER